MEIGALLLLFSVLLGVVVFVARPFLEHSRVNVASPQEHQLSSLLAERDRLITALQELDFDHTLGKIPTEDYPLMRADLLQRAADALRRLDTFQTASGVDAESRVEAAVAARRADAAQRGQSSTQSSPATLDDDALEDILSARRAARGDKYPDGHKSAGFCPGCGKPMLRSDKFCPNCGKSIK